MRELNYVITDPQGMHARPVGLFVKEAAACKCTVKISKDGKEVDAKRILGVMSLGIKQGQEITVKFDGEDEEQACEKIKTFLEANL